MEEKGFKLFGSSILEAEQSKFDKGAFVPVWKQEARDERGRKRFHGAFTGGFSAGYFNSVGSKEGWKPREYVSSRNNKGDKIELKVQDFMDEEDIEDANNATRWQAIQNQDVYEEWKNEKIDELKQQPNAIGSVTPSLLDIFVDGKKDSIGVTILKQLGWKPGYGLGPHKNIDKLSVKYGLSINKSDLLPPPDVPVFEFKDKKDTIGLDLGSKEQDKPTLVQDYLSTQVDSKLNDDGDYELNPYNNTNDKKQMKSFIDDDDDVIVLSRKRRKPPPANSNLVPTINSVNISIQRKLCHDSLPPLPSFILSGDTYQDVNYQPPILPINFDFTVNFEKQEQLVPGILDSNKRAHLIGEKQSSILQYLKEKDQLRILNHPKEDNVINDDTLDQDQQKTIDLLHQFTMLDSNSALKAKEAFLPFEKNEKKQKRYLAFLNYFAKLDTKGPMFPKDFTDAEKIKEIQEFQSSANMFRPLSSAMASRFTSSKNPTLEVQNSLPAGLISHSKVIKHNVVPKVEVDEEKVHSVQDYGIYGKLTRVESDFVPQRLLCKRFNINYEPKQKGQSDYQRTSNKANAKVLNIEAMGIEMQVKEDIVEDDKIDLSKPGNKLFEAVFGDSSDEEE